MEWYCIATTGRKERTAAAALEARQIETFAPRLYEATGARLSNVPLFPGYVLALSNLTPLRQTLALWRQSHYLSAVGIRDLVGICGKPSPVEPGFVEALQEHVQDGIFVPPGKELTPEGVRYIEIAPGTEIKITQGPYAGVLGQFERMRGPIRSIILTKMFGRACYLEVDRASIELLTNAAETE